MKIGTSKGGSADDFRSGFTEEEAPFLGILLDSDSQTKIEVDRDETREEISFRTQGERIAYWVSSPEEPPALRIFTPSEGVDLDLFTDKIKDFYRSFPEIPAYLKGSFTQTSGQLLKSCENDRDMAVVAAILGIRKSTSRN